jgi:hypothetical protein
VPCASQVLLTYLLTLPHWGHLFLVHPHIVKLSDNGEFVARCFERTLIYAFKDFAKKI